MVEISPIQAVTVAAAVVTVIIFIYEAPGLYRTTRETIIDLLQPDVVAEMFGVDADIQILDEEEYETKLKEEIGNATRSVYHISIHGYSVDYPPEQQVFEGDAVEQRYLFLNPATSSDAGDNGTGRRSGIESIRDSPFDPDALTANDKFEDKFSYYYRKMSSGDWSNIHVKVYSTTPWIRCAIIDENRAGFKVTPTLYDGRKTVGFWTEDSDVVKRLIDLFEDIWHDSRTIEFERWYHDWMK